MVSLPRWLSPLHRPRSRREGASRLLPLPRGMKRVLTAALLLGLGFSEWNSASLAPLRGLLPAADQLDPTTFSPEEIRALQRRFGVHGPQPRLAQLFTHGVDQLTPVRNNALTQLQTLQPVIQQVSRRSGINPMLLAAILFDEIQHAKPGESLPIAAHSGLFSTLGPAQLGVSEMVKQGLLPDNPTAEQVADAREQLLDPERNVALLAGKLSRLLQLLELEPSATDNVSGQRSHAKAVATLA